MRKQLLIPLVFLAGCIAQSSPEMRGGTPPGTTRVVDRVGCTFDDDLDAGGELYVGRVVDSRSLVTPAGIQEFGSDTEWGTLTFRVSQTLRGTPRHELKLPYNLRTKEGELWHPDNVMWPDFRAYPGPLLVLVLPTGYDGRVGPLPGLDGAATCVFEIAPGDSSIVEAMQKICRLHDIKDSKERLDMLTSAVADGLEQTLGHVLGSMYGIDGHGLVRAYAAHAVIAHYGRTDPDLAVDLLLTQMFQAVLSGNSEAQDAIAEMARLVDPEKYPAGTNKVAIVTLLGLLHEPGEPDTPNRNREVLSKLHWFVADGHLGAAQILVPEQRLQLSKVLAQIAAADAAADHHDPFVATIPEFQAWLNKPPASATQPAATQPAGPGR